MLSYINLFLPSSISKIGFEDIKYAIKNPSDFMIINTLSNSQQECLIYNTIQYENEETVLNKYIEDNKQNRSIIIYGKNSSDDSINKKHMQLKNLGLNNIYLYYGGLFEWLLLQDIYSFNEFPTTSICKDMLKYKPILILPG
jgi:hypothetical protein